MGNPKGTFLFIGKKCNPTEILNILMTYYIYIDFYGKMYMTIRFFAMQPAGLCISKPAILIFADV